MRIRMKPEILYEDAELIVCVKPAGLPVQTAKTGQTDLVSLLKNERAKRAQEPYIGIVHRLDQPVKGVMVFAKTKRAAAELSAQISARRMKKEYLAVICHADDDQCRALLAKQDIAAVKAQGETVWYELHDFLLKNSSTNTSEVVAAGTPGAKEAWLSYTILAHSDETQRSLVRIRLGSGRHHQIRVQFAHAGMPVYGDIKYAQPLSDGVRRPIALVSSKIGFFHPDSGNWVEFESDELPCLKDTLENI